MFSDGLQHMDTSVLANQFFADIKCLLDNLSSVMANSDGWWESIKRIHAIRTPWWWWDYIYIYIYKDWLISLLNGISIFVGYLMRKLSF